MSRTSHLFRRGQTWSARLRVPADVAGVIGKTELVQSLSTTDLAEAKRRLPDVLSRWHAEFEAARARHGTGVTSPARPEPTKALIEAAVWGHYEATLRRDEAQRSNLPDEMDAERAVLEIADAAAARDMDLSDPFQIAMLRAEVAAVRKQGEWHHHLRTTKLAELRKHLTRNELSLITHEVDAFLAENGLSLARTSTGYKDLARLMMRAEIEALERTLERDAGNYTGAPKDPIVRPPAPSPADTVPLGETLCELFEIYARENPNSVRADTLNQARRDVTTFIECVGGSVGVAAMTKQKVREWKSLLQLYPVKATETAAFRGHSFRQIIERNKELGKPVLSPRTVNRYLGGLGAFCHWLVDHGYIEHSPLVGMYLAKDKKQKTFPFTVEQLQTIFTGPLFTGCQSDSSLGRICKTGNVLIRDHRYWVPLVMLYSGARPGEIGQLLVGDVKQQNGQWVMHITDEVTPEFAQDESLTKSVKTSGSVRIVPIHNELIALGLLDHHNRMIHEGSKRLFPTAKRNERGQMMEDLSELFSAYLTRLKIKRGRGFSLYSLRHTVTDALRRAGKFDHEIGLILGHERKTTTSIYGVLPQGNLDLRTKLVAAIMHPTLSLDHLKPRSYPTSES